MDAGRWGLDTFQVDVCPPEPRHFVANHMQLPLPVLPGLAFHVGLCFERRPLPNRLPSRISRISLGVLSAAVVHTSSAGACAAGPGPDGVRGPGPGPGPGRSSAARRGVCPSPMKAAARGRGPADLPINIPDRPGGGGSPDRRRPWPGLQRGRTAGDARIPPLTAPRHSN